MKDLAHEKIAFIAKITAGATHELNNVFATIREAAGLISDLLLITYKNYPGNMAGLDLATGLKRKRLSFLSKVFGRQKAPLAPDKSNREKQGEQVSQNLNKLTMSLSTVQKQVNRGVNLTKVLNRFAHYSDEPVIRVELGELISTLTVLLERFARVRAVDMLFSMPNEKIYLTTDAVMLQLVLFRYLEAYWTHMPFGGQINLSVTANNDESKIYLYSESDVKPVEQWLKAIESVEDLVTKDLKGRVVKNTSRAEICLALPTEAIS